MGVTSSTVTCRRANIVDADTVKNLNRGEILDLLGKNAFKDPNISDGETESDGFVVFDELFNTDFEASSEKTFIGSYIVFAYRRDKLKIPSAYLKALVQVEQKKASDEQGGRNLGRAEKVAIKERVEMVLLRKVIPSVQTADVVWSLTDNSVRVFSGSRNLFETALELFEATFQTDLLSVEPFTRLLDLGHSEDELERLELPAPIYLPALLKS